MNKFLNVVLLLSIVSVALAATTKQDPEVNGPFHLPSFVDQENCTSTTGRYNVFSSVINLQTICGGIGNVICGDSRRRWCSLDVTTLNQCLESKPSDDTLIDYTHSMPTDAEYAICLEDSTDAACPHADWVNTIPQVTIADPLGPVGIITINCKPRDTSMPVFGTCADKTVNAVSYFMYPNFTSKHPANWNSCGPNSMDATIGQYCTTESRKYCNLELKSCQKDAYTGSDAADAAEFDFTSWNSVDNIASECFKDMHDIDNGSFLMEMKLWVSKYDERLASINSFKTNLQSEIQAMNAAIEVRVMEDSTIDIKMPTHCPAPPEIAVPPAVLPCLGAAAQARRISSTVAMIDGKKADHQWRESLKNTNYKMLGEISQCSNGQAFPCHETVLAHHPATNAGTLHCFIENKLVSDINIDFKCFKSALVETYYNEYKNFLETTAQKWIDIIEEKVFPGKVCETYKYADNVNYVSFTGLVDYNSQCALQVVKDLANRDDSYYCGSTVCCNNADDIKITDLQCVSEKIDDEKGSWGYTLTGGSCVGNNCYIDDLELKINFTYGSQVATGSINIDAENLTVVRLSQTEILEKLLVNASDPTNVCVANTAAEQACGLTLPATDADKYTVGTANYCLANECCQKQSDLSHLCIAETVDNSSGSPVGSCNESSTEFWFNNDMHAKCLEDSKVYNVDDVTQGGIAAGSDLTVEGDNADVSDAVVTDGTL